MQLPLWKFTDSLGTFSSDSADKIRSLYFPLCNEGLMSCLSPFLHGDIKSGQNSFLTPPVSRIDLSSSRASRNFWVYLSKDKVWSATGASKDLKAASQDEFKLEAGLLWHKITRRNLSVGLAAEIRSFIPLDWPLEIMQVRLANISGRQIKFTPTIAVPMYCRGAANIRDHRHVTGLLQRIILHRYGVISRPTLSFDESGHRPNKDYYFVLGYGPGFSSPKYLYPTQEIFCGEAGDLEAPQAVLENLAPRKGIGIQGKEPMGGLRFNPVRLLPGKTASFVILSGVAKDKEIISRALKNFNSQEKIEDAFGRAQKFWIEKSKAGGLVTGDAKFDNWLRWVSVQPVLRRIFGCSFLPDFDYGRGGRGWRDLWQDALSLTLSSPQKVRPMLVNNLSGVRLDGSNATIIGKGPGEFIADRNDIARVWMDHGIWPLIASELYINETGDFNFLFEECGYFGDQHIFRSRKINRDWRPCRYKGSILEHLLIQCLSQFYNVGEHNFIRLEGADWNDGLDMAFQRGESVAFSCMYSQGLEKLAGLIAGSGRKRIEVFQEAALLFKGCDYASAPAKRERLEDYFKSVANEISGKKVALDASWLVADLRKKAAWMSRHIRDKAWLRQGSFNGYYDNKGRKVESGSRLMLASQVFAIMSGVAKDGQIRKIIRRLDRMLFDKGIGGYRLNTDFKAQQHDLGRAFSFIYGDKENGAVFSHMVVMYAYALYRRGFAGAAWEALSSLYKLAVDSARSKIYPCLPEYFNQEARGMYAYLTGSASWFILTIVTQVLGIRGQAGDLVIEPKLPVELFRHSSEIQANRIFCGRRLKVVFVNRKKIGYGQYKIKQASLNSAELMLSSPDKVVISRKALEALPKAGRSVVRVILE